MYAVIMAGGKGTRFWPESRSTKPKQFLSIGTNEPLLIETAKRMLPLVSWEHIVIVGNKQYEKMTHALLPRLPISNILSEPCGRNTAPCLGLASMLIAHKDPHAVIVALPADHIILKEHAFRSIIKKAHAVAHNTDSIITIGITPTMPHTGYGYIEASRRNAYSRSVLSVRRFVEKPDHATARAYLKKGTFYWNSGMFIFKAQTMINALQRHTPHLYGGLREIVSLWNKKGSYKQCEKLYKKLPSISIDYGIMEKYTSLFVMPCSIGWNDVGSWSSLADVCPHDKNNNVLQGNVIALDSHNSIIKNNNAKKLIALIGCNEHIIVDTPDALLIAHKNKAQDVKRILEILETKKNTPYL